MNRKKVYSAVLTLLCGLLPLQRSAAAAEAGEDSDVYTLGEVVVSGRVDGVEASETVHTVTAEDIRDRNARSLDQAISLLPGVNVRTGGDGVPRIDIRGFRTRHVVLLLDGVPVNSAFDQQFDPTIIPTENIARIKLTSGASSVLYGQGGLGGVINIITKKGIKGVQGMLAVETGDNAPYLAKGSVSGAAGKFDFFLSTSSSQIDGFPLSDDFGPTLEQGAGYRRNSDKERHNLFGNIGFAPNRDLAMGLTFSYNRGSFGKPSSIINDPLDPFASAPKYERVDDFEGFSLQLASDWQVTDRLSLRGWTFINQQDENVNLYDNSSFNSFNLASGSFRQKTRSSIKGVSLQPKYEMGRAGTVTLSLSTEWDEWENSGLLTVDTNSFVPQDDNRSFNIHTAGIEYEISPLKGLGLVAGYSHHWQTRDELNADDFSLLTGAHYDLFSDTRLKASFKRGVRFPSLGDLYDVSKGNPGLVAERSCTYEGGVEQKLPFDSVASITGFYTVAKNLIQSDQSSSRNTNLAEVDFKGFEVSAATRFAKNILLRGSYTYLDSRDRSRAGREQQQYTPGNKLALEGKYDFDCGFTPYTSLLYVGNQYFYTKNNVTPVQKARLNAHTLVNLKLSQRLLENQVTLNFGVNNLFDEDYETSYGLPQPGRFIFGGVEFRL